MSPEKTAKLAVDELQVLGGDEDENVYHAVHARYFTQDKQVCPTCLGTSTRVSKVIQRKFTDVLLSGDKKPRIINLIFAQRYYRCNVCKSRVFPESITFAERGSRYTNRLSDILADDTLHASYEKVCKSYGVPASKASVGIIMRRRLRYRQALLAPIKTPHVLAAFEVLYYGNYFAVMLGLTGTEIHFLDILPESSEDAYLRFFAQLDRKAVRLIYIDPVEQLHNAVHAAFPEAQTVVTDECILRYIRDAFSEIIEKDGKRCSIHHRVDALTKPERFQTTYEKKTIDSGLKNRPRLRAAYHAYQDLLQRMESPWEPQLITDWAADLPRYLDDEVQEQRYVVLEGEEASPRPYPITEFGIVSDVVQLYQEQIGAYLSLPTKASGLYVSAIQGIVDAIKAMPHCIYDVLRARMLLNTGQETVLENGIEYRTGIRVDLLTESMNKITASIKKERENDGY